jgi:hypothetical protein
LFWTPDPEEGICHQKKDVVIAYEGEDGDIEKEIKRYTIKREQPEAQDEFSGEESEE